MGDAIRSVSNQTLDKEDYEVVVIKDHPFTFEPADIHDLRLRVIDDQKGASLGHNMLEGINASSAEIISFLEEDDMFTSNKLSEVVDKFSSHDISYFHNCVEYVDDNLSILNNQSIHGKQVDDDIYVPPNAKSVRTIANLYDYSLGFNNSSISISRDSIAHLIPKLTGITHGIDGLLGVLGVNGSHGLYMSGKKLTQYRVHNSLSHLKLPFDKYVAMKKRTATHLVQSASIVSGSLTNRAAVALNNDRLSYYRLMLNIYSKDHTLHPAYMFVDFARMVTGRFHKKEKMAMILRSLMSRINYEYMSKRDYEREQVATSKRIESS